MKRISLALLALLTPLFVTADLCQAEQPCCEAYVPTGICVEARMAAFFPAAGRYKEIYGSCNTSYQVEISKPLYQCNEGWANFEWISKEGSSHRLSDDTRIYIANFSVGARYPYALTERLTAYAGLGIVGGYVGVNNHFHADSPDSSAREKENKAAFGGVIKSGLIYLLTCDLYVNVFVDYSYQPVKFDSYVNLGGFKTGAGIGYKF